MWRQGGIISAQGSSLGSSQSSGPGLPDLTQLPSTLSGNGPDTTAYDALNVPGMSSGGTFSDPVTGVLTCKITDSSTPAASEFYPAYSTYGLQISRPWGANSDQYTIAFIGGASGRLVDYKLGGTVSNFRTMPFVDGNYHFSRQESDQKIMYGWISNQLRRYDTGADAYDDTGSFPYTWNSVSKWVQFNNAETWATANHSTTGVVTALDLSTGSVITQTVSGRDEIYSGYNNIALVNAGAGNSRLWNLATDTLGSAITFPTNYGPSHVPSMRGFWIASDTTTGGGAVRFRTMDESETFSDPFNPGWYKGQWHHTGHWWDQDAGSDQWWLISTWDNVGGDTAAADLANIFINASDGEMRLLGHHYSETSTSPPPPTTTDSYWSQAHTTISTDGRLALFGSNMNDDSRIDLFVQEVPRAS